MGEREGRIHLKRTGLQGGHILLLFIPPRDMKGHGNAPSPYEKEDKMLKKIHSKGLYIADHDWLVSRFHFHLQNTITRRI